MASATKNTSSACRFHLRAGCSMPITFRHRANNFLDHSNIGESSIYYPVTIDGALIQAWELTLRTPHLWRYGQGHLAYSNQIAQQRGNITGGLICIPIGSPACDAGFNLHSARPRPTQHSECRLQRYASQAHLRFDQCLLWLRLQQRLSQSSVALFGQLSSRAYYVRLIRGKDHRRAVLLSVSCLNVANYRILLDNSLTFGGFHYNDPRQIYGEVRYRFKF